MNNNARNALNNILANPNYGRVICNDSRLCEALLKDLCGEHRKEIAALVGAVREKTPQELLSLNNGLLNLPPEIFFPKLIKRLHNNLALDEEAAHWAVESWALALGVISHPVTPPTSVDNASTPTQLPTELPTVKVTPSNTSVSPPTTSSTSPYPVATVKNPFVLQAMIAGSVIGVFFLGGIVLSHYLSSIKTVPPLQEQPSV